MNLLKSLWNRVRKFVRNRYDSAFQGWGERSWLFQTLQDAHLDIDAQTRQELQRVHRYLISNSPVVQRIRCLKIQFGVGFSGLQCVPNSNNEDWNEARHEAFEAWACHPEVYEDCTLRQCTVNWRGALFDDGEVFIFKTSKTVPVGKTKAIVPALLTMEAHRCRTPSDAVTYNGNRILDGIELDANGRKIAYWFKRPDFAATNVVKSEDMTIKNFDRITADKIIHKINRQRIGQLRGIPEGFSVFNLLRDYADLHKLEMGAAKLASSIGNVETNPSGELDASTNRRSRLAIATQSNTGAATTKNAWQDYKVTLGSQTIGLRAGDSLQQFMVARPTVATQDYWDTIHSLICIGYNTPKLLVFPASIQGTVTRADLDVCASAFRREYEIVREILEEIYQWQGDWAAKYDLSQDGQVPDDYQKVVIRPPRAPNVDIGYTAQALELELQMGTKTIQDVYAERQQNWRQQLRQIAEAESYIDELADEFGISPGRISTLSVEQAAPKADVPEVEPVQAEPGTKQPQTA